MARRQIVKGGAIFPHADIGTDGAAIRDFARAVEDAGFVRIRPAGGPEDWINAARCWWDLGATHVCLNAVVRGTPPREQLDMAIRLKPQLGSTFSI